MKQNYFCYTTILYALALLILPNTLIAKELNCFESDSHTGITYFLVDRSDILKSSKNLKQTFSAIQQNIKNKKTGERLVVGVITGRSSDTRIQMDRVKPKNSLMESALKLRRKTIQFSQCIDRESDKLSRQNEKHNTSAILETLGSVSKVLRKDVSKRKRLIIYSDMVQNSEVLSFYKTPIRLFGRPTTNHTNTFLEPLANDHLVPDFNNVTVYVVGTGGTVSDRRARVIEQFWRAYFKKTGANLLFYSHILTEL